MRHRLARIVVLGLVLAFPLLLRAAAAPGTWDEAAPIVGAEAVLVGGLIVAARNRRRLLATLTCEVPAAALKRGSRVPHSPAAVRRRPG